MLFTAALGLSLAHNLITDLYDFTAYWGLSIAHNFNYLLSINL